MDVAVEYTKADAPKETLAGGDDTFAAEDGVHPAAEVLELGRGDPIGRYLVLERIGRGGMGVVYKAFDPQLDRAVAIKLLVPSNGGGTIGRTRLLREAQAMARIAHPNVITVYDVGTVEGRVFFTMELVDGLQLGKWLAAQTRSVEQILDVFVQAGKGIVAAHDAGVVHRDFKPDNVLVDRKGRVRVLDFGLARRGADAERLLRSGDASASSSLLVDLTTTGEVMGTPAYMAPEQFVGGETDGRTDQFAFCVALYEALVGKRPFRGESFVTLRASVLRNERQEVERVESVPEEIWPAIDRGLQGDPSKRFASMRQLIAGLRVRPPRRTRLWAGLGLAGLGAAGLATQLYTEEPKNEDPCRDVADEISQTWNDAIRRGMRDSFVQTGAANGQQMANKVAARLDEYVAGWKEARIGGCVATRVEHSRSEELQAKALDCLGEAHDRLADAVHGLASPTSVSVQSALSKTSRLVALTTCTQRSLLEVRIPLPLDPIERAEVEELESTITHARKLIDLHGDTAKCLEMLDAQEERVRALKHRATLAHQLAARATCQWGAGLREDALQTEERAFEASLAASDDLSALKLAAGIAHRVATGTDDFDGAETWLRRAEALAQRHALELPDQIAAILNVRGILASRRGNLDEALARFEELEALTRDDAQFAGLHIVALSNVGVVQANGQDLDAALTAFQNAALEAEHYFGSEHPSTARARAKVAQILVIRRDFATAEPIHERALATLRAHSAKADLDLAYEFQALGIIKRNLGDEVAALAAYEEAYAIRKTLGALDTIEATELMTALAHLMREVDRFEEAQALYDDVLRLRSGDNGTPIDIAEVTNFLGRLAFDRGDHAKALRLVRRARAMALTASEDTMRAHRSDVLYDAADLLAELGEPDLEAYAEAERAAVQSGRTEEATQWRITYAELALDSGDVELARTLAKAAADSLERTPFPPSAMTDLQELQVKLANRRPALSP